MRTLSIFLLLALVPPLHGQGQNSDPSNEHGETKETKVEPSPPSTRATCMIKQDGGTTVECEWPGVKSEGYLKRLFSPENTPNIALVLVGIGGIWAALCTLRSINKQAHLMELQAKEMSYQNKNMIKSQRAWILIEIGELPDFQPRASHVEFLWIRPTVKNFGSTVAKIERIRAVIRLNEKDEVLPEIPEYPLGQGADVGAVSVLLPPNTPIRPIKLAISGEEYTQVRVGSKHLYLHGFIEYSDLGSKPRRTAFCFYYAVQRGFSPDPTNFYLELTAPPAYNQYT